MGALWNKASTWALIAANVVPIIGVMFFGWDLRTVMLLYWAESAVIGFYNVLKMLWIGGLIAAPICLFFIVHYGGFMFGHLVFLLVLTQRGELGGGGGGGFELEATPMLFSEAGVWTAITALMVSHGVSFVTNFLGREAAADSGLEAGQRVGRQMIAPYPRIVVMHVTIIFGAILAISIGTNVMFLVLLIVLKVAADLFSHGREHGFLSSAGGRGVEAIKTDGEDDDLDDA